MKKVDFYFDFASPNAYLSHKVIKNIKDTGTNAVINRLGSMMTIFFTEDSEISNFEDSLNCDTDKYAKYFKLMLDSGVYLPPSQYECCFFSAILSEKDVEKIINSNRIALEKLKE